MNIISNKKIKFFNSEIEMYSFYPTTMCLGVVRNSKALYFYNNGWNLINSTGQNNTSASQDSVYDYNITKYNNKIYNTSQEYGSNEFMYNRNNYNLSIGFECNIYTVFDNYDTRFSFSNISGDSVNILYTTYDDNTSEINFLDQFSNTTNIYAGALNNIKIVSVLDTSSCSLKIYDVNDNYITSAVANYDVINIVDVKIYPKSLGSEINNYITIPRMYDGLNNTQKTHMLNRDYNQINLENKVW